MKSLLGMRPGWALAIFLSVDPVRVGQGMGMPVFSIGFGLAVGWYLARVHGRRAFPSETLRQLLCCAALTAAVPLLLMAVI